MSQASPEPQHRDQPPGEDELWEAVADPSRRKVLDLILAHGQATPTALAAELPFTRQAVAKHLAVLARAGLVEGRRHGREVHYTVRPDRDLDGVGCLLDMVKVLLEEVPAYAPGAHGKLAVGQMADEVTDRLVSGRSGVRSWHAYKDNRSS